MKTTLPLRSAIKLLLELFLCLFLFRGSLYAQSEQKSTFLDLNYFHGNIARHNDDIAHLITGHPGGIILGYNHRTLGHETWEQLYNYPDYGVSFIYQELKNTYLGDNFGLYAHYNFYFLQRRLMLRVGQGLAYTTNPYDTNDNFRNVAFGTQWMSSTYLMLNYQKENVLGPVGLRGGLAMVHYSNANVKAPNTSINTLAVNLGLQWNFDEVPDRHYDPELDNRFTEPVKFNFALASGVNESDFIGSGQYVFYVISAYADKRLNRKSAIQAGTEVFFSNFLKEYIRFRSIAYPEDGLRGDEDFKRAGVFAGHELFVNRWSVVTQLGYYWYYPVDFEGRTYFRAGLKRYFGDHVFGMLQLKSHGAKAEAVEIGLGLRI